MVEVEIGTVGTFFARPMVASIDLVASLNVGERIHILGHTTDLETTVESMEIDNVAVTEAAAGQSVGIQVPDRVRRGDRVYQIEG